MEGLYNNNVLYDSMQVKRKEAAGGIIIRSNKQGNPETVLVQHAGHKGWGFPKGHLDKGELPKAAAVREVEEETGARGEIVASLPATEYSFVNEKGKTINKIVYWYLMEYKTEGNQTHAHEIAALAWLPLQEVAAYLTFQNDLDLFQTAGPAIERFLQKSR